MNSPKERRRNLRLILTQAHRRNPKDSPGPSRNWRTGLMNRLPDLNVPEPRLGPGVFTERLVWRFVPAAGALTLFLAILVSQVSPDRTEELARLISADSTAPDLYTFYQREYLNE